MDPFCYCCSHNISDEEEFYRLSMAVISLDVMNLGEMIIECAGITLTEGEIERGLICSDCKIKVEDFYNFRQKIQETYERVLGDVVSEEDHSTSEVIEEEYVSLEYLEEPKEQEAEDVNWKKNEKNQFVCLICERTFHKPVSVEEHIKRAHSSTFDCETCGANFSSAFYLKRHIKNNHTEKPHQCQVCKKQFESIMRMRQHVEWVHKGQPRRKEHKCKSCNKVFSKLHNLKQHLARIHDQGPLKREFECAFCDSRFINHCDQVTHELRVHSDRYSRSIMCERCGKSFRTKEHLKVHTKDVHADSQGYCCHKCGKRFKSGTSFRVHFLKHEEGPQKCQICGVISKNYEALKSHVQVEHAGIKYECLCCLQSSWSQQLMTHHVSKKHPEKLVKEARPNDFIRHVLVKGSRTQTETLFYTELGDYNMYDFGSQEIIID